MLNLSLSHSQIFVNYKGENISINCTKNDRIIYIKHLLFSLKHVSVQHQVLVFGGVEMANERRVVDYDVAVGTSVMLVCCLFVL